MVQKSIGRCAVVVFAIFAAVPASLGAGVSDEKKSPIDVMTVDELKTKVNANEPILIIDVRNQESYANSDTRIKGAIHVNARKLKYRLGFAPFKDVPKDREVVTYCDCPSDESSIHAAQVLLESGFKRVRVLKGGWHEWRKASGPVEPRPRG